MKTTIENVKVNITTKRNSIPTSRPVPGRFKLSAEMDAATFVEEDGVCIVGEPKSRRIYRGKNCSVWYNPEKERYAIRICLRLNMREIVFAESDFEECINYLRGKYYGKV